MSGWTIRPATLDDLPQLAQLEAAIFVSDAWSPELILSELSSMFGHYVVVADATDASRVLGYAGIRVVPSASEADVQTIAIVPELRGQGVGRALLEYLHDAARQRGAREMFLDVRVDNEVAQNLYRSLGYEVIGRRAGYYQPDNVDSFVMRADLLQGAGAADG